MAVTSGFIGVAENSMVSGGVATTTGGAIRRKPGKDLRMGNTVRIMHPPQPRPTMRRPAVVAAVLVAAASVAVVSLVSVAARVPDELRTSSGGSAAGSLAGNGAGAVGGGQAPQPTAEQQARFLARLDAVAPWLVPQERRRLTRARATCADIRRGEPTGRLVSDAQERFTDVSADQAAEIVEAVKEWCAP
jgi:hypothetical protein